MEWNCKINYRKYTNKWKLHNTILNELLKLEENKIVKENENEKQTYEISSKKKVYSYKFKNQGNLK
jgi:hypothetical protein